MELKDWLFLTLFCLLGVQLMASDDTWNRDKFEEEAGQTFNLVFHKYNAKVRPPDPFVVVKVELVLRHIRHLDVRRQELQTVLDLDLSWHDSRLEWYPDKVYQITLNKSMVWTPDVVFTNGVTPPSPVYPSDVKISHNGNAQWKQKVMVTTSCHTEPREPTQSCLLSLGFISTSYSEVSDRYFADNSSFEVADGFNNHNWRLELGEMNLERDNDTQRALGIDVELSLARKERRGNGGKDQGSDSNRPGTPSYQTYDDCCNNGASRQGLNLFSGGIISNLAITMGFGFIVIALLQHGLSRSILSA